jgi:hypothetical protein
VVEKVANARPLAEEASRRPQGDALAAGLVQILEALAYLHRQQGPHGAVSRETVFSDGKRLLLTGATLQDTSTATVGGDLEAWAEITSELLEGEQAGEFAEIVREAAGQIVIAAEAGRVLEAPRVIRAINRAAAEPEGAASEQSEDVTDETERSWSMRALVGFLHLLLSTVVGLFTTLLTLALIAAVVAGGLLWFLDQLPAEVAVPNVVDMAREEATDALEARGLEVGRVRSVYREDVDPGHVAETMPPPGMTVREGREVTLVVSMGAARVSVPRLTGLKLDEARALAKKKGLKLVHGGEMRSNMPEGEIVQQEPSATRKIAQGETVVVRTSGGPDFGIVEVPPEEDDEEPRRMVFRRIEIVVPRGDALQRVRVREGYGEDLETTYDRLHRPGDRIKLDTYGRPGKLVKVAIEGEQVFETQL